MSKEEFDQKARDWDANPVKIERARDVAAAIRSNVPISSSMKALEYGCGTGLLSFALQPYLAEITLADNSTGMLTVLNQKIKSSGINNMHPLALDLEADVPPDASWDLVYSLMTLHHISDTVKILAAFYQVIKPGGYLCIADLDEEDGSFHGFDVKDVHFGFNREKLGQLARKTGFQTTQFSTAYLMNKMTDEHVTRGFPVFLMVAKK